MELHSFGILVPQPGIESPPWTVKAWIPSHHSAIPFSVVKIITRNLKWALKTDWWSLLCKLSVLISPLSKMTVTVYFSLSKVPASPPATSIPYSTLRRRAGLTSHWQDRSKSYEILPSWPPQHCSHLSLSPPSLLSPSSLRCRASVSAIGSVSTCSLHHT